MRLVPPNHKVYLFGSSNVLQIRRRARLDPKLTE